MKIEGKKVVDAKGKLQLQITPQDVKNGTKRAPDACAAAKACIRQLGASSAKVHLSRTYVEFPDKWVRYHTPQALRTEIISFDRGERFEAGDYALSPMQAAKRTGKRQGSNKPVSKAPKKRAKAHRVTGVRGHASGWAAVD